MAAKRQIWKIKFFRERRVLAVGIGACEIDSLALSILYSPIQESVPSPEELWPYR